MAIQDIIKELEELEKSTGGGGRTDTKKRKAEQEAKTTINEASVSDLIGYISLSAVRFSQTKQPHKPARRTNPHLTTTT